MAKKAASKIKKTDHSTNDDLNHEETNPVQETTVAPKKRTLRKKVAVSDDAKPEVKRTRSRTKIDSGDSSASTPVMKAFWGVFNPMMVQVAQYDYAEEPEAQKAAADLTEKKKAPHFVQLIKKVI